MATATVSVINYLQITACDSTTADGSWSNITASLETTDPSPIEGTGWVGAIVKQADDANECTFAKTGGMNLSGKTLRWPMQTILKYNMKTKALGGCQLAIDDGTNKGYFNVAGSDTYTGGWELLSLDCGATPDEGTNPTEASATTVSINYKLSVAAKNITTAGWDNLYCGDGLKVYGGTSGDEIGFSHIDTADVYHLMCEQVKGPYRLRGAIQFGDDTGTASCYFEAPGTVAYFDDIPVNDSLYKLTALGNTTGTTVINLSNITFTSENAKPWKVDFLTTTNVTSITLNSTTFQNATNGVVLNSICSGDGTVIDKSGQIEPGTATLDNFVVKNSTAAAALALPASHNIGAGTFISAGTGHAISGYAAAGDYSLTDLIFTGYAATDGSTGNEAVYVTATTGTVNLNVVGGTAPSVRTAGATVNVINNPTTVTGKVTTDTGTDIESANVFLATTATASGGLPFEQAVTSITRAGTTATATFTAVHNLNSGDKVFFEGITDNIADNNRVVTVTVSSTTVVTFTTVDTGSTAYTGTITSTFVVVKGLTDINGEISLSRVFPANQNIGGWARKSSGAPYYKQGAMTGTISTANDVTLSAVLVED